ncbi:MAG: hypothetical protein WAL55_15235 [Candidatus Acidiferrales bacterium]
MKSITVKIPSRWKVDSQHAQAWLRDYFVHPAALPLDNFAAEKPVCLSLNERQADALARGLGEPRAVALRRLLAAHVQELPPVPGAIVHVSKPERAKSVRRGAAMNPDGVYVASSTREIGGQQFASITDDAPVPSPVQSSASVQEVVAVENPSVSPVLIKAALWLVPIILIFLFVGSSGDSAGGDGSSSSSEFPEWRPQ